MEYLATYALFFILFVGGLAYVRHSDNKKHKNKLMEQTISSVIEEYYITPGDYTALNNMINYHITKFPNDKEILLKKLIEKHKIPSQIINAKNN